MLDGESKLFRSGWTRKGRPGSTYPHKPRYHPEPHPSHQPARLAVQPPHKTHLPKRMYKSIFSAATSVTDKWAIRIRNPTCHWAARDVWRPQSSGVMLRGSRSRFPLSIQKLLACAASMHPLVGVARENCVVYRGRGVREYIPVLIPVGQTRSWPLPIKPPVTRRLGRSSLNRAQRRYLARSHSSTQSPSIGSGQFPAPAMSAVGGAGFHGAAQLPRSRMLGRPVRVAPPPAATPAGGGGPSASSIRAVSAVSSL